MTKTATIEPTNQEIAAGLQTLAGVVKNLMEEMKALKTTPQVRETPTPTLSTDVCKGWTDDQYREYAKANLPGANLKGRFVANETKAAVRAHASGKPSTPPVQTPNGSVMSNRFGANVSIRERDGVQISSNDATEALRTHPMRAKVNSITQAEWATIAQMGAYLKYIRVKNGDGTTRVTGDPNGGTRPNPGNLNGFDRRIAKTLSQQEPKDRKVWTIYQGCLVLVKLEASGFKF